MIVRQLNLVDILDVEPLEGGFGKKEAKGENVEKSWQEKRGLRNSTFRLDDLAGLCVIQMAPCFALRTVPWEGRFDLLVVI